MTDGTFDLDVFDPEVFDTHTPTRVFVRFDEAGSVAMGITETGHARIVITDTDAE